MNQKGFAPIIFILGILIASGLIIGGSFYFKNNILTKRVVNSTSNMPTQTTAPNPTINSDSTNSWKAFIDEYKSYTVKYPSEVYIKLSCPEYNNDLILVKRTTSDKGDILELPKCDRKPDLQLSTSSYSHYGGLLTKPVSTEDIMIDGVKAKKYNFSDSTQVSLELNKINYDFYFFDQGNIKIFDQILTTFKFLDQTKLINDAKRLDDFANLQAAINVTQQSSDFTGSRLFCSGSTNQIAPCFGSSLTNSQSPNGNGWIKMDFSNQTIRPVSELPRDPINNTSHHYVYCSDGNAWEISMILESPQQIDKMENDGGNDPSKYEVGSSLQLVDEIPSCKY